MTTTLNFPTWCPYCRIYNETVQVPTIAGRNDISAASELDKDISVVIKCADCHNKYTVKVTLAAHLDTVELELLPNGRFKSVTVRTELDKALPRRVARITEEQIL